MDNEHHIKIKYNLLCTSLYFRISDVNYIIILLKQLNYIILYHNIMTNGFKILKHFNQYRHCRRQDKIKTSSNISE